MRTVLRFVVLAAFACVALVITLNLGVAVLSVTGLSADPHGYGVIFGVAVSVVLAPVALGLWLLYRYLRHPRA
ncbi:hypothetical protein MB27_33255 [Actinoplanes utahensis]|uniref:Uncharacterized protein n=1 Tax=Actinoplanes utahensis TaxID=1869 RepID=A0A0A6X0Y0_ACTUT|nr:hypothetical protein MB27_33255 [Actinoplanes utahensis]